MSIHWFSWIFAELGDIFASIGVRELQPNASEAFAIFSDAHRYITLSLGISEEGGGGGGKVDTQDFMPKTMEP